MQCDETAVTALGYSAILLMKSWPTFPRPCQSAALGNCLVHLYGRAGAGDKARLVVPLWNRSALLIKPCLYYGPGFVHSIVALLD